MLVALTKDLLVRPQDIDYVWYKPTTRIVKVTTDSTKLTLNGVSRRRFNKLMRDINMELRVVGAK